MPGVGSGSAPPARGQRLEPGQGLEAAAGEVPVHVFDAHAHVRDLAGQEMVAPVQRAVHHHARADAGADGDEGTRLVPTGGTSPPLAKDREVHVVLHDHRRVEGLPEDLGHGHVGPALQVRGQGHDHPAPPIDGTRRARAHREQPIGRHVRLAQEPAKGSRQSAEQDRRPHPGRCRDHLVRQPFAAQVGHRQPGLGRPKVDSRGEAVPRVELHGGGPAASARGAGSEIADEADAREVRDEAPDRGRGKTRGLDQLGTSEGRGLVHGHRQDPLQVLPSKVACVAAPDLGARAMPASGQSWDLHVRKRV
jgi:hypothetical protein